MEITGKYIIKVQSLSLCLKEPKTDNKTHVINYSAQINIWRQHCYKPSKGFEREKQHFFSVVCTSF